MRLTSLGIATFEFTVQTKSNTSHIELLFKFINETCGMYGACVNLLALY